MKKPAYLPTLTSLVRCYQSFQKLAMIDHRANDITESQFDVIATLGNTCGMTCKDLGEKTLITKGTLTGVLDRLEAKGYLTRTVPESNRRSLWIALTPQGQQLFDSIFYNHLTFLEPAFNSLTEEEHLQWRMLTQKLMNGINTEIQEKQHD